MELGLHPNSYLDQDPQRQHMNITCVIKYILINGWFPIKKKKPSVDPYVQWNPEQKPSL